MDKKKRILAFLLTLCMLVTAVPLGVLPTFAASEGGEEIDEERVDAMDAINSALSGYMIGEKQVIADDGYIGIGVELSIYFDKENNTVKSGYNGTPVIVYVVNTMAERTGTKSDTDILMSMLDRGYVVVVLDYLNNKKAISPDLDWSVQGIRNKVKSKTYFTDSIFPSGTYEENHVVPAGYDVSLKNLFWEADKHGTDGTLEQIVRNWNTDFRGSVSKGKKLVKWVYPDGTRKKVDTALDGTTPVWYDESGAVDLNGEYTLVKWTVATSITDCVYPDGTPLDLGLYINIVYPTNPAEAVPVMSLANSSEYLTKANQAADRPHFNGFLFNGYAAAVFDYLYVPMARSDAYGYYDGNPSNTPGAVTGNQMTYSVHVYNDTKVNTAAMRYLRYLALSDTDTYNFDLDAFGYYGNSKGGWATFLGEAVLQQPLVSNPESYATEEALLEAINAQVVSFNDKYQHEGHHGETRYENGITETYVEHGVTIDGGERQPWLAYNGKEIISGVQLTYASNGSGDEYVGEGHSPTVVVSHMYDDYNAAYGTSNTFVNLCRNHNIPSIFFEVPLGHTLVYGDDLNYGVNTYVAFFDFVGYHLKGDAVKVLYVSPKASASGVSVGTDITVKFTGPVSEAELSLITVSADGSEPLAGTWTSAYGDTEWTFSPIGMKGSTLYTVSISGAIKGDNGRAMGNAYSTSFTTEYDNSVSTDTVEGTAGSYVTLTAPALVGGENKTVFRFRVTNDAANIAEVYAVSGFDAAYPDSSVKGALLGSVNLRGAGYYEIDLTEYAQANAGQSITLLVAQKKTAGVTTVTDNNFNSGISGVSKGSYATISNATSANGTGALKVVIGTNEGRYTENTYYGNLTTGFNYSDIIKSSAINDTDYGRKFTVSMQVYDEVSRVIQFKLNICTDKNLKTIDYDMVLYNVTTKAGEWIDVSFEYVVYDRDYGAKGSSQKKGLTVAIAPDGDYETPIYFDNIKVTETVTDVEATDFVLARKKDGGIAYKAPTADKSFTLYNGTAEVGSYDSWREALSAYKKGYTLRLNRNYTLTDADLFSDFSTLAGAVDGDTSRFDIDLNGYTVSCANTKNSLFWFKSTTSTVSTVSINISGGEILLGSTPLMSYESSTVGKTVLLNATDVTFGIREGAKTRSYMSTADAPVATEVMVALDGCVFNIPDGSLPYNSLVLLENGTAPLTVSYEMCGGEIKLTSQRWVSIHSDHKANEFTADEDGKYTTLTLSGSEKPLDGTSYLRADGYAVFSAPTATGDGGLTYTLVKNDLSTRYGIVPEQYADEQAYPYVIFDEEGEFLLATDLWAKDNGGGILNKASVQKEGKWFIVLRRDVEYNEAKFNNFAFIYGEVTIDLNGHTFTCASSAPTLFAAHAKRGNTTRINIENGEMVLGSNPIITLSSATPSENYDGKTAKNFFFNFENVRITASSASTALMTVSNTNVAVNGNLTFTDCEIDLTSATEGFKLLNFSDSMGRLNGKATFVGGLIKSDSFAGLKLYDSLGTNSVTFVKNDSGLYTAAETAKGGAAPTDNIPTSEGDMMFALSSDDGTTVSYTLEVNPLSTKYGVIPAEYADANTYPFAIFMNGEFVRADKSWGLAVSRPKDLLKGASGKGKELQILLRRDYSTTKDDGTYSLWHLIGGSVVVDLNGFTLTRDVQYVLDLAFNNTTVNDAVEKHDINVTFKNGSIISDKWIMGIGISSGYEGGKNYKIVFEGVDFSYKSGAQKNDMFSDFNHSSTKDGSVSIKFKDCDFDLTANASACIVNAAGTNNVIGVSVEFAGGTIKASKLTSTTLFKLGSTDSAVFTEGEDGKLTTLTMPSTASAPTTEFNTNSGPKKFGKVEVKGDDFVYELVTLKTPYGTIPDQYASPLDYPFVYFDGAGNFKLAHSLFYGVNAADSIVGKLKDAMKNNVYDAASGKYTGTMTEAYVLMRRDYQLASDEKFDNLSQIKGTMNIDLGGYALTSEYRSPFGTCIKGWSGIAFPTTISVSNGTILTKNTSVVDFSVWNSVDTGNPDAMLIKLFTYSFDNVTFRLVSGSSASAPLIKYSLNGNTPSAKGVAKAIFNNCTFDYSSVVSTGNITVFNANPKGANSYLAIDISVNGGTLLIGNLAKTTVTTTVSEGSSLVFGKSEGKYIAVEVASGSAQPTSAQSFNTTEGVLTLKKVSEENGMIRYELVADINTPYGKLPGVYADAQKYPLAVFKDGTFVGAYSTWKETGNSASAAAAGDANASSVVTILLRRDFENPNSDTFWSISDAHNVVIDLNNFTFTRKALMLDLSARLYAGKVHTTNITVKNGTILIYNGPFVASQYSADALNKDKVFNLTYDNVSFGYAAGATSTNYMWVVWDNGRDNKGGTVNAVYNGCTFDLATNAPSGKITVFNVKDSYDSVNVNITVNGGTIIASSLANVVLLNGNGDNDTVRFGKHDGSYVTLKLGSGAPFGGSFDTVEGGKGSFVGTQNAGEYVLYVCDHSGAPACSDFCDECGSAKDATAPHSYTDDLDTDCNECGETREVEKAFELNVNLTLGSEIRLNFYAPVDGNVTAIAVNGKALTPVRTVTVDGKSYTLYTYDGTAPSRAMQKIAVTVTYVDGTETKSVVRDYSVIRYAQSVLTNNSIGTEGQALVKDLLGFIKTAYEYFGNDAATAEEIAYMNQLCADYPATAVDVIPDSDADPSGISNVISSAQFMLSDGVIKLVLNVKDGTRPVTVSVGGVTLLSAPANHGKDRLIVELRAYQLCDTLTVTSGTDVGTYGFLEYAEGVMGTDAELDAMLKAMYAYSVSALEYKSVQD